MQSSFLEETRGKETGDGTGSGQQVAENGGNERSDPTRYSPILFYCEKVA